MGGAKSPMEHPWSGIVCYKSDGNVAVGLADTDDVSSDWILVVWLCVSTSTSNNGESMLFVY